MSYEDVKKELGDDAIGNDDKKSVFTNAEDFKGKTGIDALIAYDCESDVLNAITLFINNGNDSSYTDDSLLDEYTEQLDKL